MFEFCNLSVNLKPVIYSSLHASGLSVHNKYLSEFCLFVKCVILYSVIILAILRGRACRVACHSFTFSGYVVVVIRADFMYLEVLRRIDIEERGCVASLPFSQMDGFLWK